MKSRPRDDKRKNHGKKIHHRNCGTVHRPGHLLPITRCNDCKQTAARCSSSGCSGTKEVGWRIVEDG